MHRAQILLDEGQYERLREQSRASGTAIGELVRRAIDQVYGTVSSQERLLALENSFGTAGDDDFDGLDGASFVDRRRRGLGERLRTTADR